MLFDSESAGLEDFCGGDALVEEVLDNGASDGGKQEFRGEGKVWKRRDLGGFHLPEGISLSAELAEVFAGGPGDFSSMFAYLIVNCSHSYIIL